MEHSEIFFKNIEKTLKDIPESTNVIYVSDTLKMSNKVYDFMFKLGETLCWNCCHAFLNTPVFLPIRRHHDTLIVKGCFCTFGCAKRYAIENHIKYHLLQLLHKKYFHTMKIPMPPKRLVLKAFGGAIDINSYRQLATYDIDIQVNWTETPIIHQIQQTVVSRITMEESTTTNQLVLNKIIPDQKKKISVPNTKLALPKKTIRRKNPLITE